MYSRIYLDHVAEKLSKQFSKDFKLIEEDTKLVLMIVKIVSENISNNKLISKADCKLLISEEVEVGDKLEMPYTESNLSSILELAKSELTILEQGKARVIQSRNKRDELSEKGIISGALLLCTIKRILPLGDLLLYNERIPETKIFLSKRDALVNEFYKEGLEIYVVVTTINIIGKTASVNVTRRSTQVAKELILQSTLFTDTEGVQITNIARIPGRGVRAFIKGDFSKFLGTKGANVRGVSDLLNREFIRFLRWDPSLPIRVINSLIYDGDILDIYYPDESEDGAENKWILVVEESKYSQMLRNKAEALTFTRSLTGVEVKLVTESYLDTEHKTPKYEGFIFLGCNDLVQRYYLLALNKIGIYSDDDLVSRFRSTNLIPDKDYIGSLIDKLYTVSCPNCECTIGINSNECPNCGGKLNG